MKTYIVINDTGERYVEHKVESDYPPAVHDGVLMFWDSTGLALIAAFSERMWTHFLEAKKNV